MKKIPVVVPDRFSRHIHFIKQSETTRSTICRTNYINAWNTFLEEAEPAIFYLHISIFLWTNFEPFVVCWQLLCATFVHPHFALNGLFYILRILYFTVVLRLIWFRRNTTFSSQEKGQINKINVSINVHMWSTKKCLKVLLN